MREGRSRYRDAIAQAVREQAHAALKQAEIAAIAAVNPSIGRVLSGVSAQQYHPEIGERGGNQEARAARGIAEMTAMNRQTTAFLVGKQGFAVRPFAVGGHGGIEILQRGDEKNRLVIRLIPDGNGCDTCHHISCQANIFSVR